MADLPSRLGFAPSVLYNWCARLERDHSVQLDPNHFAYLVPFPFALPGPHPAFDS